MKGNLTQRGVSLLGSLLLYFVVTVLSPDPAFSVSSSVLLLIFALEAIKFRMASRALNGIRLRRQIEPVSVFVGESLSVKLEAELYGMRGGGLLQVRDAVPGGFEVASGTNVLVERIEGSMKLPLEYGLKALEMGKKDYEAVEVKLFDRLGLFTTEKTLSCSSSVKVYPRIPLAHVEIPGRPRTVNRLMERGIAKRSLGMEFTGVREYISGDDHRMIAWKAMARSPSESPMTKEHDQTKVLDVFVVILAGKSIMDGPPGKRKVDRIVESSLTLANHALKEGYSVYLIFPQGPDFMIVSGNLSQLAVLVSEMTFLEQVSTSQVSQFIKSHVRKRSLMVFVADTPYPESIDLPPIQSLRLDGHIVNMILLDTPAFLGEKVDGASAEERLGMDVLDRVEDKHLMEFMVECSRFGLRCYRTSPGNISPKMIEAFVEAKRTPLP